VLGMDTRPSGPMIRDAVIAWATEGGVNVVDLCVVSTPGVAIMIKHTGADGGIVITASHNPLPYNGIKFMNPHGLNLPADAAERLKGIWQAGKFAKAARSGKVERNNQTHDVHIAKVLPIIDPAAIAAGKFRVVVDSINGAGCESIARMMRLLGVELVHVNNTPDGNFAHEPEPTRKNLAGMSEIVRREKAHVGFAQDPDADRLAIVDERGEYIGEEYTLTLTTAFTLMRRKGSVATNLSTTRMVDDVCAAAGAKLIRTAVGEANVASAMMEQGCIFGGEGNGGVIDPRVVFVRDSLVGIPLMLNYMAATGKSVSQLVAAIPRYEMFKDKFPCPLGGAVRVNEAVKKALAGRAGAKIDETDGLRVDLPEGWLHIRASNTEPIMRITAEAPSPAAVQKLAAEVRAIADKVLGQ
jgi:phosphomannomutase